MTSLLHHASLGCSLRGVHDSAHGVVHFRGIRYGRVPERFAVAQPPNAPSEVVDCTKHGPRCPQMLVDVGHLLRLPSRYVLPREEEDEFECLNLDICMPEANGSPTSPGQHGRLPVCIWIHGGSQAVSFGSTSSKLFDMTRIVCEAATVHKPIIVVSVHYRLNVFAHGNSPDSYNLALSDQSLAIDWVASHIAGFGGDPLNITLAGESAGAVYCHAHIVAGSPVRQCILLSGSLFLSPPQPGDVVATMRERVAAELERLDNSFTLEKAPVEKVIQSLEATGIQSWYLAEDDAFSGWQDKKLVQRILVCDVEFESVLWQNGIWASSAESIVTAFERVEPAEKREALMELYGIRADRPSSCKLGALDVINDYKFVLPAERLIRQQQMAPVPTSDSSRGAANPSAAFRCIIDEPNPWQPSHGAHHAIDLLLLFGGFDMSLGPSAEMSGRNLRDGLVHFINGSDPWEPGKVAAFGPYGMHQVLDLDGLSMRRRVHHVELLKGINTSVLDQLFLELARGKLSLLN